MTAIMSFLRQYYADPQPAHDWVYLKNFLKSDPIETLPVAGWFESNLPPSYGGAGRGCLRRTSRRLLRRKAI